MSLRIIHLSDPHFGTIKEDAMKALLLAVKMLNPQAIIFSGDITQRARRNQFEQARIFTNTFEGIPILIMPGNHDIPLYNLFARFFHPYYGFKRILKGRLNQEINIQGVQIMALNSTRRSRVVQGVLDLKFLKRWLLKNHDSKIRIVVCHHPLDCRKPADEKNLLLNRHEVMPILDSHNVDMVLSGHIHDPYIRLSNERYPQLQKPMIIGVAGTCLSHRTREDANNSFNVIDIEDIETPKLTVSRHDLTADVVFEAKESHRFIRTHNQGWQKN